MKKYIDYQGGKIYVQSRGRSKSRVLVLLHGFCEEHTIWTAQVAALTDVRVLCIDLPGFGKSTTLQGTPDLAEYALAVEHVLATLGVNNVVMLGHSLGGYVTMRFAALFSERLIGFGLVNSHPLPDTPERRDIRNKTISLIQSGGQRGFVKQLISGLFGSAYAKAHPEVVNGLIQKAARFPAEGIVYAASAMRDRADQTEILRTAQVPVAFILGANDHLVPNETQDAFMHLPTEGQIHLIPDVAHMAMFEATDSTTQAMQDFVMHCAKLAKR